MLSPFQVPQLEEAEVCLVKTITLVKTIPQFSSRVYC